jgi:C1A family cysteine protease
MKTILLIATLFAAAMAVQGYQFAEDANFTLFSEYMREFKKDYASVEELLIRFNNFKNSLTRIDNLNKMNTGAKYAINKFSDMSVEEFKGTYLNYRPSGVQADYVATETPDAAVTSFDWRTRGAVTPVKDQQQCGSCWAFSATEEIESMWILAGNSQVILSPQQIVSCDKQDAGCNGGDTITAYQYVISAGGQEDNADYPYTSGNGNTGTCKFNSAHVKAKIKGSHYATTPCYDACSKQNETLLANNLVAQGPVSICVYAESWMDYSSGILSNNCPHDYDDLDHCVQLVGFDFTGSTPYWIVRNSWNTDWGVDGYIYIKSGSNLCGVADEATIVDIN